jgi:hypothetical protein
MTYTHIPAINYIFVGITTAVLSYVTWAELQEKNGARENENAEPEEPTNIPASPEPTNSPASPEPTNSPASLEPTSLSDNSETTGGKKKRKPAKKTRRMNKKKNQTRQKRKLKSA